MSLSNNILFLSKVNPYKSTINLNPNSNSLESPERTIKTRILNFVRWCIHKICSRIPQNAKLDKVTNDIFKDIDNVLKNDNISHKGKESLRKAVENLQTIISKDGGAHGQKAKTLLDTVNKIKSIDAVQNLGKNEAALFEPIDHQAIAQKHLDTKTDDALHADWNFKEFFPTVYMLTMGYDRDPSIELSDKNKAYIENCKKRIPKTLKHHEKFGLKKEDIEIFPEPVEEYLMNLHNI